MTIWAWYSSVQSYQYVGEIRGAAVPGEDSGTGSPGIGGRWLYCSGLHQYSGALDRIHLPASLQVEAVVGDLHKMALASAWTGPPMQGSTSSLTSPSPPSLSDGGRRMRNHPPV